MGLEICITTYNRKEIVEVNARSLHKAILPKGAKVTIIDDSSSEFDVDWLKTVYPKKCKIIRRDQNSGGASFASHLAISYLLSTKAEVFLLLDSDFIVNKNCLKFALQQLSDTDGFLSLFNTPSHAATGEVGSLLVKKSIGSAATLWTRECAANAIQNVARDLAWDWRICEYFALTGRRIFCVRESLVQHIGLVDGEHIGPAGADLGIGFDASGDFEDYQFFLDRALIGHQKAMDRLEKRVLKLEARIKQLRKGTLVWWGELFLKRLKQIFSNLFS